MRMRRLSPHIRQQEVLNHALACCVPVDPALRFQLCIALRFCLVLNFPPPFSLFPSALSKRSSSLLPPLFSSLVECSVSPPPTSTPYLFPLTPYQALVVALDSWAIEPSVTFAPALALGLTLHAPFLISVSNFNIISNTIRCVPDVKIISAV